jgi:hypothetical protein
MYARETDRQKEWKGETEGKRQRES